MKVRIKKRGFVLLETIVVTSVLGIVLLMMYPAFIHLINITESTNRYDKVDYLYRTRAYNETIDTGLSSGQAYKKICEGTCGTNVYDAVAVYIINPTKIDNILKEDIYISTKRYLRYISDNYNYTEPLLVIGYLNEDDADNQNYEYASVKFLTKEKRKEFYGD